MTGTKTAGLDILVPIDGSDHSEQALPYALALLPEGGAMRLISVVAPADTLLSTLPGAKSAEAIQRFVSEEANNHLQAVADRLRSLGAETVTTLIATGDPSLEILAAATDLSIGMIVMSSAGRGALGRLEFGSVADRVARSATIPVMIVRKSEEISEQASIRRIIVPIDGSKRSLKALPVVSKLAKHLHVPVLLMTASDPAGLMFAYGTSLSAADYEQIEAANQLEMGSRLEGPKLELQREGIEVSTAIEIGPPAHALSRICTSSDIIVMTSHGRSGITRWLIGSVAEQLVREAPVPVVLVPARD